MFMYIVGGYIQALLTEYGDVHERRMLDRFRFIHGISPATIFFEQKSKGQDHLPYDIIAIRGVTQTTESNDEQVFPFTVHL